MGFDELQNFLGPDAVSGLLIKPRQVEVCQAVGARLKLLVKRQRRPRDTQSHMMCTQVACNPLDPSIKLHPRNGPVGATHRSLPRCKSDVLQHVVNVTAETEPAQVNLHVGPYALDGPHQLVDRNVIFRRTDEGGIRRDGAKYFNWFAGPETHDDHRFAVSFNIKRDAVGRYVEDPGDTSGGGKIVPAGAGPSGLGVVNDRGQPSLKGNITSVQVSGIYCQGVTLTLLTTMGQNEAMTRSTHPPVKDWSPEAEIAMTTFGNRTRNEIIRYLLEHGPEPRGEIVANVDASDASVAKHLVLLEDAGIVEADVEPGRRHGRAPRYSVNPDRIRVLLEAHLQYLTIPKQ